MADEILTSTVTTNSKGLLVSLWILASKKSLKLKIAVLHFWVNYFLPLAANSLNIYQKTLYSELNWCIIQGYAISRSQADKLIQ